MKILLVSLTVSTILFGADLSFSSSDIDKKVIDKKSVDKKENIEQLKKKYSKMMRKKEPIKNKKNNQKEQIVKKVVSNNSSLDKPKLIKPKPEPKSESKNINKNNDFSHLSKDDKYAKIMKILSEKPKETKEEKENKKQEKISIGKIKLFEKTLLPTPVGYATIGNRLIVKGKMKEIESIADKNNKVDGKLFFEKDNSSYDANVISYGALDVTYSEKNITIEKGKIYGGKWKVVSLTKDKVVYENIDTKEKVVKNY